MSAPARTGTLVVGGGHAGLSLVMTLRELGDTEPVHLACAEAHLPYDRPPLTKGYLRGEEDLAAIGLQPARWFDEHDVTVSTGDPVVSVARDGADGGGSATLASGHVIAYDRLALVTGAGSRSLPVPGADLDGVASVRELAEADALAARLARARQVVVIGGGYIGLEVAEDARLRGAEVTVVEASARVLNRMSTTELSDHVHGVHTTRGTRILLSTRPTRILGEDGHVTGVELDSGEVLAADTVVIGIGAQARTGLAEQLGLDTTGAGIVVDEFARTSDGSTVAAGDCTIGPNPYPLGVPGPLRLESVHHATEHARTAAATLVGHPAAYVTVPWFWSDQGDLALQIAGLTAGADRIVRRGDESSGSFSLLAFREGRLIGAECVRAPVDYIAVKRGLEKGMTVDPDAAGDASVPLKRLLQRV